MLKANDLTTLLFCKHTQTNLILNKSAKEKNQIFFFFYLFGSWQVYFIAAKVRSKYARVVLLLFILVSVKTRLTTFVMDVCSSMGRETKQTEKPKPEQNLLPSPRQQ